MPVKTRAQLCSAQGKRTTKRYRASEPGIGDDPRYRGSSLRSISGTSAAIYGESMSSDLIAWVVALTLGIAVVGLGLRRNLADVTRSWLPRYEEVPEAVTVKPDSPGGEQGRRQLSPRQRRLAIWAYLIASTFYAAMAVLRAGDRPLHTISAAAFAIGAVVFMLRGRRPPSNG
jgi:hypothetical protein